MTTYSITQLVYSFAFSAGSAGGLSFSNQGGTGYATMQQYVQTVAAAVLTDKTIQGLIGSDWTAVWGPVVYARDTSNSTVHADNTMGCYYSPSNNLFVVAVAGTNPISSFDWFDEDLNVNTLVPWTQAGVTGLGNISAGAYAGLQILLALTDGGSTMLQALASYITNNKVTGATIAVAGHSLGGALSQCLALYMYDNASTLGLSGQQLVALPTAAPTPGDADWAQTYEAVIQSGGIAYVSEYNTLDVVPHAWHEGGLATIPTLYDAYIRPHRSDSPRDDFMGILAAGAQLYVLDSSYQNSYKQVKSDRQPLSGTFDTTVDDDVKTKLQHIRLVFPSALKAYAETLINVARFVAQAAVQHTTAYPPLLLHRRLLQRVPEDPRRPPTDDGDGDRSGQGVGEERDRDRSRSGSIGGRGRIGGRQPRRPAAVITCGEDRAEVSAASGTAGRAGARRGRRECWGCRAWRTRRTGCGPGSSRPRRPAQQPQRQQGSDR